MLDFVKIRTFGKPNGTIEIYPDFIVGNSRDLMIKGRSFYAVWDEEIGLWRTDEYYMQKMVDEMIFEESKKFSSDRVILKTLSNFSSNKWTEWQKYSKSLPDHYHDLDSKVIFANDEIKKEDYATRRLPYAMVPGDISSYERLMNVLYEPEEREKIEWAIGAVISGDSTWIQKFLVLYGSSGTGKSTVLNIIEDLFSGYTFSFNAEDLGSNKDFSMESMKDNNLIGIQHDGDLSKIESNAALNSIISHEKVVVNEKHKAKYTMKFKSFLFMGTNKPVRITDAKSGIIRRLIDVKPTGNLVSPKEYDILMEKIKFEYGAIANHCYEVYKRLGPKYYNGYVATSMIQKTNDFYNFMEDNIDLFTGMNEAMGLPLNVAWLRYKHYCEDANIKYPMSMRIFKDEMKNYFEDFKDRWKGQYSVYLGFLENKFAYQPVNKIDEQIDCLIESWIQMEEGIESEFDKVFADCPAQYANSDEVPTCSWDKCKTKLEEIDTKKIHYVRLPENVIVIDFDLKNEKGEKDEKRNLEEASKWPATYAELSKGGAGIHLHYYYDGDVSELSRLVVPDVEVKTFTGKSSLRRKLLKCNKHSITKIISGLPLKEVKKTISEEKIKSEKKLRELIKRNLRKEIHPATKPSMDFIYKILQDAYESDLCYDVRDMRPAILQFAMNSTHQGRYCVELLSKMKFCSEENSENVEAYEDDRPMVFFDTEVFPNLFVVCWKKEGVGSDVVKMINPSPSDISELAKMKLVGFNNRKYDNHILYARMMGYTENELFELSQNIVVNKTGFFGEAYNLSYTDVFDFLSSIHKIGLKKWEIKLGIHHQECPYPWDQPVPEDKWLEVADYCANDVVATEIVFNHNHEDWKARIILAEWAEMTVNDTTNSLTTRIIVGKDPNPQSQYIYTDLSTIFPGYKFNPYGIPKEEYDEGAKIVGGKSIYRGEDPSEGGKVSAVPGMYVEVAVLDVASMHPRSAIRLMIFGKEYTMKFKDIVDARVFIKHKEYDKAKKVLPEKLWKYLDNEEEAAALANALKTPINSVYGLTSASFPNKLRDPRNVDNIVAKYGALFMINLRHEVEDRGWKWVHIKTDSIKIANATPEMIQFVMDYGKQYGFTFEHEATYRKMCLVNESTYIAQYESDERCNELYGYVPGDNRKHPLEWTATGAQFQVPYVFKTLFSKEKIEFEDLCQTISVSTALYLDFNEKCAEDEHDYRFVGRIGLFCPVKDGYGGGILLRQGDNKFTSPGGTKKPDGKSVYRWMESEMAKNLGVENLVDYSYWNHLVDEAVLAIQKFGDFERFVSSDSTEDLSWLNVPDDAEGDEIPFDEYMNKPVKVA